ncbi:sigma-70 family RNA polymerase sigma factor [Haloferula sp.]|uniref:sigma-70 family RNA polymerase sigma factor n=1 Tax=Haloferula sp. TaxID=2497595 RepID=UPI00329B7F7D
MTPEKNDSDEAEFIRELTKHQTAVGAFLRSMLPVHADIDSLLQEVNVTLWEKKDSFKLGSNFKAWAFQTAKFHALNEHRRLKRDRLTVLDDAVLEVLAEADDFDDETMSARRRALDVCFTKLNPRELELVKVRYTKSLSIEEYSRQHRKNSGTIRATLRRVRAKLRECINHQLGENEYV